MSTNLNIPKPTAQKSGLNRRLLNVCSSCFTATMLLHTLFSIFTLFIIQISAIAADHLAPTPQWRPVYHFTPEKNWMNDPNGLIYFNGQYHMYYQYNPYGNEWGNLSWGHAVSTDLLQWKHLTVAMWQKEDANDTTMIYSGSAVWDKLNSSGFGNVSGGPIVAIYTAASTKLDRQSQFIAYSNDGGMTYTDYSGNPVIDLQRSDFRDPNVVWLEDQSEWLMTVVVAELLKVQFYSSTNLRKWRLLGEFGKREGSNGQIWECPSLTKHFVDGDPARIKWLLTVSFAYDGDQRGMEYFIGHFNGTTFQSDHLGDQLLVDYGNTFYAAIPYNHLNQSTVVGWLVPSHTSTWPWRGQMSIPRHFTLKTTPRGIRLYQQPAAILTASLQKLPPTKKLSMENVTIENSKIPLPGFDGNAWWVDCEFMVGTAEAFGFQICNDTITVAYNVRNKEVIIGGDKVPAEPVNNTIRLQILFDKSSLEVFVNGGEMVLTTLVFPDKADSGLSVYSDKGRVTVNKLEVWNLKSNDSVHICSNAFVVVIGLVLYFSFSKFDTGFLSGTH